MGRIEFTLLILILAGCRERSSDGILSGGETVISFPDARKFNDNWPAENTLYVQLNGEPDNLHPSNGNSGPRSEILQYVHRCLLYIDYKTNNVVPGLVESMPEISADSLHFTYKLRSDITWDDGTPLSAGDIIFTAKALKCPLTNDPAVRFYWNNVKNITSDGKFFTIEMYRKNFQNISFLTSFPVLQKSFFDPGDALSEFTLEQFGDTLFQAGSFPALTKWAASFNDDANGRNAERLNGLGMYKVVKWESGQYISLAKKNNHWTKNSNSELEKSYPGKIVFLFIKDEAAQLLDFRNQKLDVSTSVSLNTLMHLSEDLNFRENYNSALIPTYNYTYICFNEHPDSSRVPLFSDADVRKALALLTPVEDLINIVYRDYSKLCRRMVSNVSPLKKEADKTLKAIEFNPREAKKLLEKSGWKDTDGDGILDKDINGKRISFTADLNYLSAAAEWKSMAAYIAEQWGKSGIRINPVGLDVKLFVQKAMAHDFDLMLGSWGGTGLNEDYTQLWHTSSWKSHGSNYSGFGNAESDSLIERMRLEMNDSSRIGLSHRLQKIIYDDQPFIFLYSSLRRNIIHKRFGHQVIYSDRPGILLNNLELISNNKMTTGNEINP